MKMKKRFAALGLAIALTLGMSTTAMAAEITVEDAVKGATYDVYKVFDATVSKDASGKVTSVSYTIPAGSTITEVKDFDEYFTIQDNGGETYVWPKQNEAGTANVKTDAEIAEFLKGCVGVAGVATKVDATVTPDKANKKVTITGLGAGYYFVDSSVGAVVMLASATETITIHEKNSTSDWGEEGGKRTEDGKISYFIGEDIPYVLDYQKAMNYSPVITGEGANQKIETQKVYQYVVKDTLPEGISLKADSFTVKINGTEATLVETDAEPAAYTYKKTVTKTADGKQDVFTIVIPWAATETEVLNGAEDFFYKNAPVTIEVTYKGNVTKDVQIGSKLTNKATINPNNGTGTPSEDNDVYTGRLTVNKYDAKDDSKLLAGAQFKIINTSTEHAEDIEADGDKPAEKATQYLAQDPTTGALTWTADSSEAKVWETNNDGQIVVDGLKEGTYYLLETAAPAGYNLMTTTTPFEIKIEVDEDGNVTSTTELTVTKGVENNAGSILPSTGGIGTTIFYVVGGILVAAAVVLLVTKKRMSNRA